MVRRVRHVILTGSNNANVELRDAKNVPIAVDGPANVWNVRKHLITNKTLLNLAIKTTSIITVRISVVAFFIIVENAVTATIYANPRVLRASTHAVNLAAVPIRLDGAGA